MLVYLTSSDRSPAGYKTIANVMELSRGVDDSEAREIICEDFLSSFPLSDVPNVLNLIVQKLRMGGKLAITEKDFKLISLGIHRESVDLSMTNAAIFEDNASLKSILTCELVESFLESHPGLMVVSKGYETVSFTIILERTL